MDEEDLRASEGADTMRTASACHGRNEARHHALIWWLVDSPKLSQVAVTQIADPRSAVFAPPVSGYEIANKERLGRLPGKLTRVLPQVLRKGRIAIHPLRARAGCRPAARSSSRFLGLVIIAQAIAVGLTVVTIDAVFRDYGVPVCW